MKSALVLTIIAFGCTRLEAFPAEEYDNHEEPDFSQYEDSSFAGARSWVSGLVAKPLGVLTKIIQVDPLTCTGLACSSCLRFPKVLNKEVCVTYAYEEEGKKAKLNIGLQLDGKPVLNTNLYEGNKVPSCVSLPAPLKKVCVSDLSAEVAKGGTLAGSFCFKLAIKDLGVANRFCAAFKDGRLQPSIQPEFGDN